MAKNSIINSRWYIINLTDSDRVFAYNKSFVSEDEALLSMGNCETEEVLSVITGRELDLVGYIRFRPLPFSPYTFSGDRVKFKNQIRTTKETRGIYKELKKNSNVVGVMGKNVTKNQIIQALAKLAKS